MSRSPHEELPPELERVIAELRRPIPRRPGAVDAVMAAVQDSPGQVGRRSRVGDVWAWFRRPQLLISPAFASAALVVAVVVGLVVRGGLLGLMGGDADGTPPTSLIRHQFVLVAPDAEHVSVVGDFNDWDVDRTPLRRTGPDGVWVGEVELGAGRHLYSFVVDGVEWVPDGRAPRAPDNEFDRPSSVLLLSPGQTT